MKHTIIIFITNIALALLILYISYPKINYILPEIESGYTEAFTYSKSDSVTVFVKCTNKKITTLARFIVYDSNNKEVDTIFSRLKSQPQYDSLNYLHGANYSKTFTICLSKYTNGLYFIEKKIPFIVKNTLNESKENIALVIPIYSIYGTNAYTSLNLYNNINNQHTDTLSLLNPILFNNWEYYKEGINYIKKHFENVYVISDIEFEKYSNIEKFKCIFFIGDNSIWSKMQLDNFNYYIKNGGKSILMHSYALSGLIKYDSIKKQINITQNNELQFQIKTMGGSYIFGGKTKKENIDSLTIYTLNNKTVFSAKINFSIGIPNKAENLSSGLSDFKSITQIAKCTIITNSKSKSSGIYLLKKGKGSILQFGSSDWLNNQNIKDTIVSKFITKTAQNFINDKQY